MKLYPDCLPGATGKYTARTDDEAAYQLADGFSVNTGWYSVHPKIGGTFEKAGDAGLKSHKINFSFRPRGSLRALASKIELIIEGIAATQGYIDQVLDVNTASIDDVLTLGGVVIIAATRSESKGTTLMWACT